MNHCMSPETAGTLTFLKRHIAFCLLAAALVGCTSSTVQTQISNRDHLLGWFKLDKGDTLIPVFKRNGTYYSVCRGFEAPLKECPEGLEWSLTPSSMTGTKVGWDADSKTCYLAVLDSQASNFTDGRSGVGEKEPMTRLKKPPGLLDTKARRPRTNDDFLGWYQPVWFPYVRIEIRKEGDRYLSQSREYRGPEPGSWQTREEVRELTVLSGQLGFTGFERRGGPQLVYNDALRRCEFVLKGPQGPSFSIRMPLARIPAPSLTRAREAPPTISRIGIPSWH